MALDIGSETHGDFRVLKLNGRLDTETSADFELAAHDLTAAGERRFVVDLAGISYVSSAGLRVLLALAKQLQAGGGALRLCGLAPSVRQVFDLSGFSKLFTIAADIESALGGAAGATAAPTPAVSKAAADLLGAASNAAKPATAASGPSVGRQAADLLGAKPAPKAGLFARLLAWLKGQ